VPGQGLAATWSTLIRTWSGRVLGREQSFWTSDCIHTTVSPLVESSGLSPELRIASVDLEVATTAAESPSGEELVDRLGVVGKGPAMGDLAVLDVMDFGGSIIERLTIPGGMGIYQCHQMFVVGDDVV
jgi:hypothetical protein